MSFLFCGTGAEFVAEEEYSFRFSGDVDSVST